MQQLDGKIPQGPLADKWDRHRAGMELVNPTNRRRFNREYFKAAFFAKSKP